MIKSLKKHLKLALLIVLAIAININASLAATKDQDYYQIELIVFKYNNTDDLNQENWSLTELNMPENLIEISQNNSNINEYPYDQDNENLNSDKNYYQVLADNKLQYKTVANRINSNSRYKIISHLGWRLPKKNALESKPMFFTAGQYHKTSNHGKKSDNFEDKIDNFELITPEISGVITLKQKRFVHSDVQIVFNHPAEISQYSKRPFTLIKDELPIEKQEKISIENIQDSDDQTTEFQNNRYLQSFKISEQRRLKYKELNYFDHPAFGVIVAIS